MINDELKLSDIEFKKKLLNSVKNYVFYKIKEPNNIESNDLRDDYIKLGIDLAYNDIINLIDSTIISLEFEKFDYDNVKTGLA